jgi:hypothetical protein
MSNLALYCTLILFPVVIWSVPVSEVEKSKLLNARPSIVAFYHMYASGKDYTDVVENQINTIKGSGLLDRLDKVFYATMGSGGDAYTVDDPKYVHIAHYGNKGEEIQTLSMLYQFCHANPTSKVLYFRDEGGFHHSFGNLKMCSLLNCYVLNPHCIDALDDHDTCGWRISLTPFIHYSGNFWWARCGYIKTLIDPMSPKNNQTYIALEKSLNGCVGTKDRYFAESWIGTAPTIHPADCMNATIDASYVWGNHFPSVVENFCHGADVPSGLPCQTAAPFLNITAFKPAIKAKSLGLPEECRENRDEMIKRSQIMYGEVPHTFLEWMDRLYNVQKLKENSIVM